MILPYLLENEKLFGIRIDDLLTVKGVKKSYKEIYRKVQVKKTMAVKTEKSKQKPDYVDLSKEMPKPSDSPSIREYAGLIPEGVDADE